MKVIAYCALRYGKEYLGYAIRSVINDVSEFHVLYAMNPSHGHDSSLPCPDTESELLEIAVQAAGHKLQWHEGTWTQEGQQRDSIHQYAPDADVILNVDSDEIWKVNIPHAIEYLSKQNVRRVRIPMIHFYRSFRTAVVNDPAYPERIIFPKADNNETTYRPIVDDIGKLTYVQPHICHMGYCQRAETIRYKLSIHGHYNEFRTSADDYVNNYYLNTSRMTDLHPVGSEYWNLEGVNSMDWMPAFMAEHPNWNKDIVT